MNHEIAYTRQYNCTASLLELIMIVKRILQLPDDIFTARETDEILHGLRSIFCTVTFF